MKDDDDSVVIELDVVTKRYAGDGRPAVDEVSLRVREGEAVAVMGPSGSGKSTLLNLIAGLDKPTTGAVTVAGQRLDTMSERALARFRRARVGMIFQFFNLLDDLTVADNVRLPAQLAGMSPPKARVRASELLLELGIAEHSDAYPGRLSGGQRQRVAIARALVNDPELLLADEPTGALDTAAGQQIGELLAELNRDGQTLVLVTHNPALAAAYATRTVDITDGRITGDRPNPGQAAADRATGDQATAGRAGGDRAVAGRAGHGRAAGASAWAGADDTAVGMPR
jgi:putative ABC transport system ATP-binding protein